MREKTPKQIVDLLDKYIVGQNEAKKSVAIALYNRYRRAQLPEDVQKDITPKNILMAGPTGVGKTEIARRLADIVDAPFVKVEATKFTEVGYVGRDVESMVRDLANEAVRIVEKEEFAKVEGQAIRQANKTLVRLLVPGVKRNNRQNQMQQMQEMMQSLLAGGGMPEETEAPVKKGEKAGEAVYLLNGKEIGKVDILFSETVEKSDFSDYFRLCLEHTAGF